MADPKPPKTGLGPIVREIRKLEKQVEVLSSPSGTQRYGAVKNLQSAISLLTSQVEFLQTQIQSVDSENEITVTASGAMNAWYPFDPLYDLRIDVLAGESGQLVPTLCGYLSTEGTLIPFVHLEIDGVLPSTSTESISLQTGGVSRLTMMCSRTSVIDVEPNLIHTIRTRRRLFSSAAGTAIFSRMTLSITRLA